MSQDTFAKISVELRLPCGCEVGITLRKKTSVDDQFIFLKEEVQQLSWYLKDRLPRHKCELVSENNPNGISPKSTPKDE